MKRLSAVLVLSLFVLSCSSKLEGQLIGTWRYSEFNDRTMVFLEGGTVRVRDFEMGVGWEGRFFVEDDETLQINIDDGFGEKRRTVYKVTITKDTLKLEGKLGSFTLHRCP